MKILFVGDSITDASRKKELPASLGVGYARLVASHLSFEKPEKYEFLNRGINGNTVLDIYARAKKDIINLKPDVVSILVGVNDVFHDLTDDPSGVDGEKYFMLYDMLISDIKKALPNVKIMILEPFVLKSDFTQDKWDTYYSEVRLRGELARKLAKKHNLTFVELFDGLLEFCKTTPATCWLHDGIHPTAAGHEYIKRKWLNAFEKLM